MSINRLTVALAISIPTFLTGCSCRFDSIRMPQVSCPFGFDTTSQLSQISNRIDWAHVDPTSAAEIRRSAIAASGSSDDQINLVLSNIEVPTVILAIRSGQSSGNGFAQVTQLLNANIATVAGQSLLELRTNGVTVAAQVFPYHVSGPYVVFDNPAAVDQWILANESLNTATLQVSITGFGLNGDGSGQNVTLQMNAVNAGVQVSTTTLTYAPRGRGGNGPISPDLPFLTNC